MPQPSLSKAVENIRHSVQMPQNQKQQNDRLDLGRRNSKWHVSNPSMRLDGSGKVKMTSL